MANLEYPKSITAALHQVMQSVGYVKKGSKNTFHKYSYASEAELLHSLRPAMLEAGLILIPSGDVHSQIDQYGNVAVAMLYTLAHKDGDVWPEKIRAFGSGNDMNSKGGVGDKGTYKAITGANKYLLFKLFQIETGDDPESGVSNTVHREFGETDPQKIMEQNPGIKVGNKADRPKAEKMQAFSLMDAVSGEYSSFNRTARGLEAAMSKLEMMVSANTEHWFANKEIMEAMVALRPHQRATEKGLTMLQRLEAMREEAESTLPEHPGDVPPCQTKWSAG